MASQGGLLEWLSALGAPASEAEWEALYRESLPRVYNYFRYRLGDGPLAEDLTATTFEKAWRYRTRYRRDRAAFTTWLLSIARNVAADHFRARRPEVALDDVRERPAGDDVEETAERDDEQAHLAALLAALPERERELIALKYGAGLTNRAIAGVTALSESNVGTILYRTLAGLRTAWDAYEKGRSQP